MTGKEIIDSDAAKSAIFDYCKRKGALAVGVADLDALERIAPPGHRPSDIMPRVKSVIALGVGGQTQGAWTIPAKALAYFGSTETRAYTISYGLAFYIENKFGMRSIYCPPDMDNESGPRVPLQSLKLHAELAGIGARSMAGDILLHPDFGYMYFASVFTELELEADQPLQENPCPAPSCVKMYEQIGQTPCMKFCPVQCLSRQHRRGRPPGGNALRHGRLRRDDPAIRDIAETDHGCHRRREPGRARGCAVRPGPQDALVQDVGGHRRSVGAMLRMHAGLPDRDASADGRPDPAP